VAEAAIVGRPHDIKGEAIVAFVVLKGARPQDAAAAKQLAETLRAWIGEKIGPIAKPDDIRFGDNLPKTRSGKIMRRILRKIAAEEYTDLGDIQTLADPSVVADLIEKRKLL
jgi:acetyl-CoA synthetase